MIEMNDIMETRAKLQEIREQIRKNDKETFEEYLLVWSRFEKRLFSGNHDEDFHGISVVVGCLFSKILDSARKYGFPLSKEFVDNYYSEEPPYGCILNDDLTLTVINEENNDETETEEEEIPASLKRPTPKLILKSDAYKEVKDFTKDCKPSGLNFSWMNSTEDDTVVKLTVRIINEHGITIDTHTFEFTFEDGTFEVICISTARW